jgi:outer membrane protein insertion porin family
VLALFHYRTRLSLTATRHPLLLALAAFALGALAHAPALGQGGAAPRTPIPPGQYVISGINVEGAQFTDANTVLLLSGLNVGDQLTIPGDNITEAMRKLWRQNLFEDISIEAENIAGNKLFLLIKVAERPRISRYTFTGITKNQADDLREVVNIVRGQRFTEAKERRVIQIVKNFYAEKGFLNCAVAIETRPDENTPNGIVVVIKVDKGSRVRVRDIQFNGLTELDERQLLRRMKNTKEQRWWRVWKRSKYIPALFDKDRAAIEEFLAERGYRDARIHRDTVTAAGNRHVNIRVDLTEGRKYYFRSIAFVGNFTHSAGRLDSMMGIHPGDVYNTALLESRLQMDAAGTDISSLYLDDGYLFFRAEPVEVGVNGDSVDVEIRIYEGPRARYRNIVIEGNDKTSDHVILRSVRTLPGNYFSRAEIIRSQREIINLGYFNQERMNIVPMPNPEDGTVDIKYVVEEKPSDQLFFQGGWGGRIRDAQGNLINNGLVATVGLQFNNFSTRKFLNRRAWRPLPSGDGQQLGLRVQMNGRNFQNYSINFVEPWLGGRKPNSLGVTTYYSLQNYIYTKSRISIIGSSLDFGTRLKWPDDYFRFMASVGYRYYDLKNAQNLFPNYRSATGSINIISLRLGLERNSINAPIYATSGSIVSLSVEATPPYSVFRSNVNFSELSDRNRYRFLEFHKWKFQAQTFMRLFANTVLVPRVMFGYLGGYSQNYGRSPFERFYLGGDGLFGFALDGREIIAMRGYKYPQLGDGTNGNMVYNKYTLELRQPLSLSPSATIWVHGFLEAGNAWTEYRDVNPFNLYRSAGAGVRIFLPIFGLLGVDFGYGFDRTPQNDGGPQFHFMIGQQF